MLVIWSKPGRNAAWAETVLLKSRSSSVAFFHRTVCDCTTLVYTKFVSKKVIVTAWWSSMGLLHHSFLKWGRTVTVETFDGHAERLAAEKYDDTRWHILMIRRVKMYEVDYEMKICR